MLVVKSIKEKKSKKQQLENLLNTLGFNLSINFDLVESVGYLSEDTYIAIPVGYVKEGIKDLKNVLLSVSENITSEGKLLFLTIINSMYYVYIDIGNIFSETYNIYKEENISGFLNSYAEGVGMLDAELEENPIKGIHTDDIDYQSIIGYDNMGFIKLDKYLNSPIVILNCIDNMLESTIEDFSSVVIVYNKSKPDCIKLAKIQEW